MDYRKKIEHYHYGEKYDSKRRFASYWHQINEILALHPKNVLEIGIGNGFTSRYLSSKGVNLTTCDIDKNLKPDYVASITQLPFPDNSFDVVMACEILEHIPYEDALNGLREIYRVSSAHAVISLPDATRCICLAFPIPGYGKMQKIIEAPRLYPKEHSLTKSGHYWEIGKKGFHLNKIKSDIRKTGFNILKTYRVFENPYHRFFILEK